MAAIYTVPFVLRMGVKLELKDIKGGVLEQEYSLSVADFPELQAMSAADEGSYLDPLVFKLRFQLSGGVVEVDGRLTARIELECGRCLCRYQQDVEEDFAFAFTPVHGEIADDQTEIELETEQLGLVPYRGEVLELLPCLQEQAVMAMPIAHLCSEDCKGLCPECGQNLNNVQCNCSPKPFNGKFGALASLLDRE
jgi:uncharacterized protein